MLVAMFERFTDPARRVLVLAQEEARLFGHQYIGPEHLLLGLAAEGEGKAAQAIWSFDVSLADLRELVDEGLSRSTSSDFLHLTHEAKKLLQFADRAASLLGHASVDTEHLLLAMVSDGHGRAALILRKLGAKPGPVRERLLELMSASELDNLPGLEASDLADGRRDGDVLVPTTLGLNAESADRVIAHAGLQMRKVNARAAGHVYRTEPPLGSVVNPGSTVTVYLA
jgi:ATP-dependent Clp protease ATP-binding subunit ClpC